MDLCADLNEKNTKMLKFKLFFSIIMTIISLVIYPQASLMNPYQVFIPPNNDSTISVYLVADSYGEATGDLYDINDAGIESVIIMPDMSALNVTDLRNITQYASNLGLIVGVSLGGTILSTEEYMSNGYKDDATDIVNDIINFSALDYVDTLELFPFINAPDEVGVYSSDIGEYLFGPTNDDIIALGDMIELLSGEDVIIRTSIHISYYRSFRQIIEDLGSIDGLDQIGINMFQPHINTVPTSLSSAIEFAKNTGKDVVIGAVGFSTHDDAHNEGMQDSWFWSCVDVASSFNIKEVAFWQWKDRPEYPFILRESIEPKYGISGKLVQYSISRYNNNEINYAGYSFNILEVILGTFSTSGSTGVISGNILFSLLIRILIGFLIGKKCKLNGTLIAALIFTGTLAFHFSLGVPIMNSPSWWVAILTYFYLYASISAGVFQIQVVSTVVRHKNVFGFCEDSDAKSCATEFMQNKARSWRHSDAFL